MIVHAKISALKQSRWSEYGARFAFGGFTTLIAGVIGDQYGPETGGLFLAFPAIFCASTTLIETHERKRKKEHGLDGYRRGTDAAALDACGAALGGIGLAGFGLMVWLLAPDHSLMSLVIASIT
jgi:hypothetical protein